MLNELKHAHTHTHQFLLWLQTQCLVPFKILLLIFLTPTRLAFPLRALQSEAWGQTNTQPQSLIIAHHNHNIELVKMFRPAISQVRGGSDSLGEPVGPFLLVESKRGVKCSGRLHAWNFTNQLDFQYLALWDVAKYGGVLTKGPSESIKQTCSGSVERWADTPPCLFVKKQLEGGACNKKERVGNDSTTTTMQWLPSVFSCTQTDYWFHD